MAPVASAHCQQRQNGKADSDGVLDCLAAQLGEQGQQHWPGQQLERNGVALDTELEQPDQERDSKEDDEPEVYWAMRNVRMGPPLAKQCYEYEQSKTDEECEADIAKRQLRTRCLANDPSERIGQAAS